MWWLLQVNDTTALKNDNHNNKDAKLQNQARSDQYAEQLATIRKLLFYCHHYV